MFGFLNIDKKQDLTSFDIIAILRKKLNMKKIGHLGTLDPMATGVLPIAIGKATRLISYFNDEKKEYEVQMLFGISTDSYDITGNVTSFYNKEDYNQKIESFNIKERLNNLLGESFQTPPMLSSKKINGKKLYEYFRENIELEREKCKIFIYNIKDISFEKIDKDKINSKLKDDKNFSICNFDFDLLACNFTVLASRGTYVRSIVNDLSEKVNFPITTTKIRRVRSGSFYIDDSVSIDLDVKIHIKDPNFYLKFKEVIIRDDVLKKVKNGNNFTYKNILNFEELKKRDVKNDELLFAYDKEKNLIALCKINIENREEIKYYFKVEKTLYDE